MVDECNIILAAANINHLIVRLDGIVNGLDELEQESNGLDALFSTLRNTLNSLKEWANCDLSDVDPRLLAGLDVAVVCCRLLSTRIDSQGPSVASDGAILMRCRTNLKLRHFRKVLKIQNQVFRLLLDAGSCNTAAQQRRLLTNKAFNVALSSLQNGVIRTFKHPFTTWYTGVPQDSLDPEHLIEILSEQVLGKPAPVSPERYDLVSRTKTGRKRSRAIDRIIRDDTRTYPRETWLIVVGTHFGPEPYDAVLQKLIFGPDQDLSSTRTRKTHINTRGTIADLSTWPRIQFESRFTRPGLDIRMIDFCGILLKRGQPMKFLWQFQNPTAYLYIADLSQYDQTFPDKEPENNFLYLYLEGLRDIRSPKYQTRRMSVILLLDNVDRFIEMLASSPLETYFPDYTGANARQALRFVVDKFLEGQNFDVYPLAARPEKTCARRVFALLGEIKLQQDGSF